MAWAHILALPVTRSVSRPCCINYLTHSKHSSRVCCSYKLTSVKQTRRACVHGHRQEGQSMRFWRTSWRKGYRASIANDLQHHSYGGSGVQRSQYHRFACVSDQPLPALLRYACRNQGWGWAVRLFLSSWLTCLHMPHPSLQKRACSLSPGRSCRDDRGVPGGGRWGLTATHLMPATSSAHQGSLSVAGENLRALPCHAAVHSHPSAPGPGE